MKMQMDKERKEYLKNYRKENLKRVPLDLHAGFYNRVKAAADRSGMTVNGYIKNAIEKQLAESEEAVEKEAPRTTVKKKILQDKDGKGPVVVYVTEQQS